MSIVYSEKVGLFVTKKMRKALEKLKADRQTSMGAIIRQFVQKGIDNAR